MNKTHFMPVQHNPLFQRFQLFAYLSNPFSSSSKQHYGQESKITFLQKATQFPARKQ